MAAEFDDSIWRVSPESLVLLTGEVHVWRASVLLAPDAIERLGALLSPDETARADRFYAERDRSALIARRGILRLILGRYLSRSLFEPFAATSHGKPQLPKGTPGDDLCFSTSHSAGIALIAVARNCKLGVDIEAERSNVDYGGIAERFFSEYERKSLRALPQDARREAFFTCWSRKEAYIKARGMGLSLPLDQFDVTLRPREPARLIATRDDPNEAARWSMHTLTPGDGYAGALVAQGDDIVVRCWNWVGAER